jgi:hypothetical protein
MRFIAATLLILMFLSCESDDRVNRNNPYLIDPLVNLQLDLSLPQYNLLNFPGNSIVINSQGIRGIVVYNIDNSQYSAMEITDPNHVPNNCSTMDIVGIEATCTCPDDENKYNIITGQHMGNPNLYPMQRYRAVRSGNVVTITN